MLPFGKGQSVSVGGDHGHSVRMQLQQGSVEDKPAFLGRHGEGCLFHAVCEKLGVQLGYGFRDIRQFRKIVFPQANNLERRALVRDLHPVVLERATADLTTRRGPDNIQEAKPGNDRASFGPYLCRTGCPSPDLKVCRTDLQFEPFGFQEKMRKDRNRVSLFDCATHEVQFLQEISLFNEEIHWTHLYLSPPNDRTFSCLALVTRAEEVREQECMGQTCGSAIDEVPRGRHSTTV